MLPIVELRGGIIWAALREVPFMRAAIVCFIGNILPIPFILLFIVKILDWLKKYPKTAKLVSWLEKHAHAKSDSIQKYEYWGLFLFVAIPLPGTGAWTGSLIASILGLPVKKSFVTIALGVLGAGIIMSVIFYLLPDLAHRLFGF
ncbi:MAG: small multi-drug export protein [Oscillospiraceae bacterium]|jgi:uncharacterized membrane protein|nr:small multi-drug export protein [Oscillospiraceae bacterium]